MVQHLLQSQGTLKNTSPGVSTAVLFFLTRRHPAAARGCCLPIPSLGKRALPGELRLISAGQSTKQKGNWKVGSNGAALVMPHHCLMASFGCSYRHCSSQALCPPCVCLLAGPLPKTSISCLCDECPWGLLAVLEDPGLMLICPSLGLGTGQFPPDRLQTRPVLRLRCAACTRDESIGIMDC